MPVTARAATSAQICATNRQPLATSRRRRRRWKTGGHAEIGFTTHSARWAHFAGGGEQVGDGGQEETGAIYSCKRWALLLLLLLLKNPLNCQNIVCQIHSRVRAASCQFSQPRGDSGHGPCHKRRVSGQSQAAEPKPKPKPKPKATTRKKAKRNKQTQLSGSQSMLRAMFGTRYSGSSCWVRYST